MKPSIIAFCVVCAFCDLGAQAWTAPAIRSYYIALKDAGVPAELHMYADGRHAFGLRQTKFPITAWPRLVETWLKTIGMISD